MKFPELHRSDSNVMKVSSFMIRGLINRFKISNEEKVFVVGMHKTGTSSMGKALQRLGYSVCGSLKESYDYQGKREPLEYVKNHALDNTMKYNAFQDTPWFLFYRDFFEKYPDAYFILTSRASDKWIQSVQKHFGKNHFAYHDLIYCDPDSISFKDHYVSIYENHNAHVRTFFKGNRKFVEFRMGIDGWDKLETLFNRPMPLGNFPHVNKSKSINKWRRKIKKVIKKLYYKA